MGRATVAFAAYILMYSLVKRQTQINKNKKTLVDDTNF